jgi:hypothetical protein
MMREVQGVGAHGDGGLGTAIDADDHGGTTMVAQGRGSGATRKGVTGGISRAATAGFIVPRTRQTEAWGRCVAVCPLSCSALGQFAQCGRAAFVSLTRCGLFLLRSDETFRLTTSLWLLEGRP